MKRMKYKMKALTVKPNNTVLFYSICTPDGEFICSIKNREDARKLIAHLNKERYEPEKSNVLNMKENV